MFRSKRGSVLKELVILLLQEETAQINTDFVEDTGGNNTDTAEETAGLGIRSFQKKATFLRSFPFFIKERGVLFRSL